MKKTNIVTPMWEKCKQVLQSGDIVKADELLMQLIFKLADYTSNGYKDDDKIEGVKLEVWKERAWYTIENAGLLDYDPN
jgi:hypothetical protein